MPIGVAGSRSATWSPTDPAYPRLVIHTGSRSSGARVLAGPVARAPGSGPIPPCARAEPFRRWCLPLGPTAPWPAGPACLRPTCRRGAGCRTGPSRSPAPAEPIGSPGRDTGPSMSASVGFLPRCRRDVPWRDRVPHGRPATAPRPDVAPIRPRFRVSAAGPGVARTALEPTADRDGDGGLAMVGGSLAPTSMPGSPGRYPGQVPPGPRPLGPRRGAP